MSKPLQFTDCPACGKRVRTTANECHHCHQVLTATRVPPTTDDDDELTAHGALEHGGYDQHDDFDYDNYLAEEFPSETNQRPKPSVPRWVWLTAWLLVIATLLPLILQFLQTQ